MRRNIAASFARPFCWAGVAGAGAGIWLFDVSGSSAVSIMLLQLLAFSFLTLVTWVAYGDAGLLRVGERLVLFRAVLELGQSVSIVPGTCDLLDWCRDCSAILAVLIVIGLARKAWLGLVAIDEEGSAPRKAISASGCEIIDMKAWKMRARVIAPASNVRNHRR